MNESIEIYIKQKLNCLACDKEEKDKFEDEMRDHLYVLINSYKEEGYSQKEAEKRAIQTFD